MAQYDGPRFAEPDDVAAERSLSREAVSDRREDVHIRNYDFRQGYDLELSIVETQREDTVLEDRIFFQPGADRSLDDLLDSGTYRVTVRLDDGEAITKTCTIDDGPDGGILIELGNGQVSVTEGIWV